MSSVFFMCLPDKVGGGTSGGGGGITLASTRHKVLQTPQACCVGAQACDVYPPDARCESPHPAAPDGIHSDRWPPCDYRKAWAVWAQVWMSTVCAQRARNPATKCLWLGLQSVVHHCSSS